jgi:hypothetical protein
LDRKERRQQELSHSTRNNNNNASQSGYLLKRSHVDIHVWRRVHCFVTDDFLWMVSRHDAIGRICLTHALLLEPAADYAPLFRCPDAFELVATNGTSHVFRAASSKLQKRWTSLLSDRIVTSYENSLLQHAELLAMEECKAASRRLQASVEQWWQHDTFSATTPSLTGPMGLVVRFGLDVASLRECCRYIYSLLPPKSPIVAASSNNIPAVVAPLSEPLDADLQAMIRSTWNQASALLARATHLGKKSTHLETLCRHVDYQISGKFRHSLLQQQENEMAEHQEPPPLDLFDQVLIELQRQAKI